MSTRGDWLRMMVIWDALINLEYLHCWFNSELSTLTQLPLNPTHTLIFLYHSWTNKVATTNFILYLPLLSPTSNSHEQVLAHYRDDADDWYLSIYCTYPSLTRTNYRRALLHTSSKPQAIKQSFHPRKSKWWVDMHVFHPTDPRTRER